MFPTFQGVALKPPPSVLMYDWGDQKVAKKCRILFGRPLQQDDVDADDDGSVEDEGLEEFGTGTLSLSSISPIDYVQ